jgi:WD40 repeat protein
LIRHTAALVLAGVFVAGCIQGSDKASKPVVTGQVPTSVVTSTVPRPVTSTVPRPVVTNTVPSSFVTRDARLLLPIADYGDVAWLTDNTFVIERHRVTEGPVIFELWAGRPDGSNFRKLGVRPGEQCRLDDVHRPYRLPDGRLGAVRRCFPKNVDSPLVHNDSLVAVHLATGALTRLASLSHDDAVTRVVWDPDLRHAIASITSSCGTLIRVTPSGTAPLDLRVGPSGHTWNTADQQAAMRSKAECGSKYGTVGDVTAAPGSRRIAFHAATSARASGVVSVWDRHTKKVTNIVDHVGGVSGTAWSPTGRWIAFIGNPGGRGAGLWLVDPVGGHLTRIAARGGIRTVSWSPDGRHLLYLAVDGDLPGSRVYSDIGVHRVDLAPTAA